MKKRTFKKLLWVLMALVGIAISICNITKTVPGFNTRFDTIVSTIIAYGIFIGPILIVCGIVGFLETKNHPKNQKKLITKRWQEIKLSHLIVALMMMILGAYLCGNHIFDMCPWKAILGIVIFWVGFGAFVEIRNDETYKKKYPEKTR